jgi:hypothetical protein
MVEMQVRLERPEGEQPQGECVGMLRVRFAFYFEPVLEEEEDSLLDLPPALHKRTTTVYRVD